MLTEWLAFLHAEVMAMVMCRVLNPACNARESPWIAVLWANGGAIIFHLLYFTSSKDTYDIQGIS